MRYPLIAVEGVDASGKASATAALVAKLREAGYTEARSFSFPDYTTDVGKMLLAHLKGDWDARPSEQPLVWELEPHQRVTDMTVRQCMMTMNRLECQPQVEAALQRGPVVLDRWYASSIAYGAAEGLDPAWVRTISATLLQPDLWLLLDAPPEVTSLRRPARDKNESDLAKLRRVRQEYGTLWHGERLLDEVRGGRIDDLYSHQTIDAAATADTVAANAWACVQNALAEWEKHGG